MTFSAEYLLEQLTGFPPGSRFAVAYSGGLDSTVLLHAMHHALTLAGHALGDVPVFSLRAIHVNHGLSTNANQWQKLCEQQCVHLGIPLHVERVKLDPDAMANLESQARDKRYDVFERQLEADECLLMAHHLDDQAETFLLRSLRGAGPRGLGAIPKRRPLGGAMLFRPLLEVPRVDLRTYAEQALLAWVEDESNDNHRFDRNFCRHEVLPKIEVRWPAYRESWQRSAQLCAEADILLDDLAAIDFEEVKCPIPSVINAKKLQLLSEGRQRNTLRYWLGLAGAPEPGWNVLTHIVQELIPAALGTQPEIRWQSSGASVVLRRYRQNLYLHKVIENIASLSAVDWQAKEVCHLKDNGLIYSIASEGAGLRVEGDRLLSLRYRQGGETCKLQGRRTRTLKKILQDANIAPWLRDRVPLLYCDEELVCIPGVGVCEGWQAGVNEPGWRVIWVPPDAAPEH
jgi:tRNA(Ile)-lysidine synthase